MGTKLKTSVVEQKGHCAAGHEKGEVLELNCMDSGGLCGFFYHSIFPNLQTFEYGGKMPWWNGEDIHLTCPDPQNPVTIKVSRVKE